MLLSDALTAADSLGPQTKDVNRAIGLFTDVVFPLIGQLLRPEIWQSDPGGMGETRLQAAVLCCKVFVKYLDTLFDDSAAAAAAGNGPLSPGVLAGDRDGFPLPDRSAQVNGTASFETPTSATSANAAPGGDQKIDGIRLWSHILQVLERLLKSGGQSDGLDEAIPESLKNIVLVMASDGYLVPPGAAGGGEERSQQQKRLWKVTFVRLERFMPGLIDGIFPGAGVGSPVVKREDRRSTEQAVEQEKRGQGEKASTEEKEGKGEEKEEVDEDAVLVEKNES